VALATCERFPDLDDEDRLLIPALAALGVDAAPAVWTDAGIDWGSFDAVVIRETWDYSTRRAEFLDWAHRVAAGTLLLNPPAVIEWNTDKHYLHELAEAGLPVVPTSFVEPGDDVTGWLPPAGSPEFVVKPAVSCGSADTVRYSAASGPVSARAHVRRLVDEDRAVMVQPYLESVDTIGETALLFFDGVFSHAIRKGPLLALEVEGERVEGLFVQEQIDPRDPTTEELATSSAVIERIPGGRAGTLYARIDLIPDAEGRPRVLEVELTEPSLFLSHSDGAADRLAAAIVRRLTKP
jgi:glutathione synthase/RimK-type ligase-like ATP-grasp enzyme